MIKVSACYYEVRAEPQEIQADNTIHTKMAFAR